MTGAGALQATELEPWFREIIESLNDVASPHPVEYAVAATAVIAGVAAVVSAVQAKRIAEAQERATAKTLQQQRELTDATLTEQRRTNAESLAEQRRAAVLPVIAEVTAEVAQTFERLQLHLQAVSAQSASPRAGGDAERWARAAESGFELASQMLRLGILMPVDDHADYFREIATYLRRIALTCSREANVPDTPPSVHELLEQFTFVQRQYGSYGLFEGKWTQQAEFAVAIYSREIERLTRTLIHDGLAAAAALDLEHPVAAADELG